MDKNELILQPENNKILIVLVNKWLDTIYDSNDKQLIQDSTPIYEALRRKLIDKAELSKLDISLIVLLVQYGLTKTKQALSQTQQAMDELTTLYEQLSFQPKVDKSTEL